jgi:hypothetical protein
MAAVVANMTIPCVYEPGTEIQILKSLNDMDNSITYKGKKYPLIAMLMPIKETHNTDYFLEAVIPRIVIAVLSSDTGDVFSRFKPGGTFKEILYPCYNAFLLSLSQSPNTTFGDPAAFRHIKQDNPGPRALGTGISDYVDSIEILDLEIILSQIKTCK